jgi:hypothetical protein
MIIGNVEEIPLFDKRELFDDTGKKVVHNFVVRNIETEEHVGIISDKYVLVQPREFVKNFLEATKTEIKRIVIFRGFVKADMENDEMKLVLFNSVDKSSGVWIVPYMDKDGMRIYGVKAVRQMHRGNVNEVIRNILADFKKVQGTFSTFLQGLYTDVSQESKEEMKKKLEKLEFNKNEQELFDNAKTYFDIYKLLYERVSRRRSNEVRNFMKLVGLIEKILWEGMSSRIVNR